eukprot:Em0013g279a
MAEKSEEAAETHLEIATKNALILYQRPPEKTDLNRPPPNWLRRTNAVLQPKTAHSKFSTENGPPSVVLASNHFDCVGEVDVVADAKDIKKLLKMPYCSSAISMSVHRIGKTLLIDSFDDPLRFNPKLRSKLQKDFNESWLFPRKKDPVVARHRSMLSKLLYYCVQENAPAHSHPLGPALEGSVQEEAGCGKTSVETLEEEEVGRGIGLKAVETARGADTPLKGAETPLKGAETPLKGADTPLKGADTPLKGAETPLKGADTPLKGAETPLKGADTPLKGAETPLKGADTPLKGAETPLKGADTPLKGAETVRGTETPLQGVKTPLKETVRGAETPLKGLETVRGAETPLKGLEMVRGAETPLKGLEMVRGAETALKAETPLKGADMTQREVMLHDVQQRASKAAALNCQHTSDEAEEAARVFQGGEQSSLGHKPYTATGALFSQGAEGGDSHTPLPNIKASPQKKQPQQGDPQPSPERGACQLMLVKRRDELVPSKKEYQLVPWQEKEESHTTFPCPVPEPPPLPPFAKDFQWTIADTRMLLGSDLPILTQGGHPAISLRLREKGKPVTVLTGLDYWLDNLMCNVPELMMCFHLDGVVQNYEVIKTEDIPHLDKNCQFNTQDVLEVAHNVLGFLKANCTREGHTYWLCRRAGEEVVKLYDLSSLEWDERSGEEFGNPFATSVATLLYRMAKNMLKNTDESINSALVHMLLDNCIELLKQNTSIKMLVSAYYLQALLVITRVELTGVGPEGAASRDQEPPTKHPPNATPPGGQSACGIASSESKYLLVNKLLKPLSFVETEPTVPSLPFSNDQERLRAGLDYIAKALILLGPMGQWNQWQQTCVAMLHCLSATAYAALAEACLSMGRLGRALRYARYSILCGESSVMSPSPWHVPGVELVEKMYDAWMICGDIHCLSTKLSDNFSSHLEDFKFVNPEDTPVISVAANPSVHERKSVCMTLHTDLETSLLRSIDCYELAHGQLAQLTGNTIEKKRKVQEHVGNSWNELGTYYKQLASLMDHRTDSRQVEKLWVSSHDCFQKSLQKFQEAGNAVNQALVYANLGGLMGSCARVHGLPDGNGQRSEFSQQEKVFYTKAADFYISGKQVLRGRSTCPGVWDQLVMDLSSVYFTMGTVLQNNAPLSSLTPQDVEREVVEVLMKALNHTEALLNTIDKEHPKYVALSAQAGNCHYQLASLYQKSAYGFSSTQSKQRQSKIQAEKHYNKALQLYLPRDHSVEILRTNMERALLYEQQALGKQQVKYLKCELGCLLDTEDTLPEKDQDTDGQLLAVLVHRLQTVLKQLMTVLTKKGESPQLLQQLKLMYTSVLKPEQYKSTRELVSTLKDLYQQAQK